MRPRARTTSNPRTESEQTSGSLGCRRSVAIWDPDQYLRFDAPRLRPALELLARVSHRHARTVLDLGCGPGNVTALLAQRWPRATITAVDNDPAMLRRVSAELPDARVIDADIARLRPSERFDVVYSNATLHWLDDHETLFPRILSWLADGGELAVQMPAPDDQPSHRTALELASQPRWRDRLLPRLRRGAVGAPGFYYDLLAHQTERLDIWTVTYEQVLEGDDPVTEWVMGSMLRPLLAQLDDAEEAEFLAAYSASMAIEYPRRSDGTTLLPYTRRFIVAALA